MPRPRTEQQRLSITHGRTSSEPERLDPGGPISISGPDAPRNGPHVVPGHPVDDRLEPWARIKQAIGGVRNPRVGRSIMRIDAGTKGSPSVTPLRPLSSRKRRIRGGGVRSRFRTVCKAPNLRFMRCEARRTLSPGSGGGGGGGPPRRGGNRGAPPAETRGGPPRTSDRGLTGPSDLRHGNPDPPADSIGDLTSKRASRICKDDSSLLVR